MGVGKRWVVKVKCGVKRVKVKVKGKGKNAKVKLGPKGVRGARRVGKGRRKKREMPWGKGAAAWGTKTCNPNAKARGKGKTCGNVGAAKARWGKGAVKGGNGGRQERKMRGRATAGRRVVAAVR